MKYWLLALFLFCVFPYTYAQVDTTRLKAVYDRCLDFSEDKEDSLLYYASFIKQESDRLRFEKGDVLSLRLKGIYEEMNSNYPAAIQFYLQSLDASRKLTDVAYEKAALSDLAIAYANLKEPHKAKYFYLQAARISKGSGEVYDLVNTYNNLAVIYTQLKQFDSARLLLNEAVRFGKPFEKEIDLSSTYNNMGNLYCLEKNYDQALVYFRRNLQQHQAGDNPGDLWVDVLNLADVYSEKKQFDSAGKYGELALKMALELDSKGKEADTYGILSKLAEYKGDYRTAYSYLKKWYTLDTAILNDDTYSTVAELQERFHAKEREVANQLLKGQIEKESLRSRIATILAIALAIIGILIAIAFIIKRNANRRLKNINDLIVQQNEKLEELNYEKNSLISIVSHDLSTPFTTIQVWGHVLQAEPGKLTGDQQRAINKIMQASNNGEDMIRRILDVERKDIADHRMLLENFDLTIFAEEVIENFKPMAARKSIQLHADMPEKKLYLLSDKQLVSRICENLLSNAIKYTPKGKNVWISISEEQDAVSIKVRDEGVGIEKDELPYLFSKYSKISSQPTNGEASNGLGLSIVKRIVQEINGKIFCESEPGKGSLFTVVLKK
ncbi:tetratricopeptide repeat-containing sensor histidine kinase [Paraflavitalea sp. CAU 1676]|uniref:tetratricopeptide repeat-containing sensor histidine kinase n=1 Tax=Paraflavitalea sp. CAU 1676 TaxID=3032598 RepID=UPI0023DBD582|nr:tetratricopeptide repeat-containing sensor histidine kinase [Paraflavitalea sp. CAU 1676]MDF2187443.1 tetratricopeptide repeat-containing sensor histidine kinase [Paraflavitalea sp. CAU 1676]